MHNLIEIPQKKQLNIVVPATILSHTELTLNQKLILGLDYTYGLKLGYNNKTHKEVGELLSLHPNIVGYCRRQLVQDGFLVKDKGKYMITDEHFEFKTFDNRNIILPKKIYNNPSLTTGAKLLWGEYNSISQGKREYFAKREYSARRLNVSEESITNWTKILQSNKLLIKYYHKYSYGKTQKIIII
ncbi:MAG: hypothetical protein Wins2KO_22360 [Winogradskyella sp.]